jgi:cyclophilin family peptidyl-prolyl cis-trans isomerase
MRRFLVVLAFGALVFGAVACGSDSESGSSDWTPESSDPPTMDIDTAKTYTATMTTSEGVIVIALDAKQAPESVNNFVALSRAGFYDGLTFHRASRDFVIQGGSPSGNGSGGVPYSVAAELPSDGYKAGSVAWAKTQTAPAGAAGSQFFIVTSDGPTTQRALNVEPYQYGYVGQVTTGLDIVKLIESYAPATGDGPPTTPVTIETVTIAES